MTPYAFAVYDCGMSTAVLPSTPMAKRKPEPASESDKKTRVPAQITRGQHDELRELCLIRLRRPIEVVLGEWVGERLAAELKKLPR